MSNIQLNTLHKNIGSDHRHFEKKPTNVYDTSTVFSSSLRLVDICVLPLAELNIQKMQC